MKIIPTSIYSFVFIDKEIIRKVVRRFLNFYAQASYHTLQLDYTHVTQKNNAYFPTFTLQFKTAFDTLLDC